MKTLTLEEYINSKKELLNVFVIPKIKLRLFNPCQKDSSEYQIDYFKVLEFVKYHDRIMMFTTEGDFKVDMTREHINKENQRVRDYTYCLN